VVPSVGAQRIIAKFLTDEDVKLSEILTRLGDETLSKTQVYEWSKSFEKRLDGEVKTCHRRGL